MKTNNRIVIVLLAVFVLSGCTTTKSKDPEKSNASVPKPMFATTASKKLQSSSVKPGWVKRYHVGPYRDPQNPRSQVSSTIDVIMEEPSYVNYEKAALDEPSNEELVYDELERELVEMVKDRDDLRATMKAMIEQNRKITGNSIQNTDLVTELRSMMVLFQQKLKALDEEIQNLQGEQS